MKVTLFSPEQANRVLPEIRPRLQALVAARRELGRLRARVEVLRVAVAGADPANPDMRELDRLMDRDQALTSQIEAGVLDIQRHGCVVKDLERGLVDFYALAGDRLVFLCWQLGEPEVAHWHTLEGGFARRQPIQPGGLD